MCESYGNGALCLIIMLEHYVWEKMHECIKLYVSMKRQGKYDECEMHMLDHMMYDI